VNRSLKEHTALVRRKHMSCEAATSIGASSPAEVGTLLLQARDEFQKGEAWKEWMEHDCDLPREVIQAYLSAARGNQ